MKKWLWKVVASSLALLMISAVFSACAGPQETPTPTSSTKQFTDQEGRTVTLDGVPQRIVSLAPSNTEILFAIGLGDKVVGVTDYADYPAAAKTKPSVGGYTDPDIEKIVALKPDLVLATDIQMPKVVPELEKLGIKVAVLNPKNLDQILQSITLVGQMTGASTEAATLVSSMQTRIKAVEDKVAGLSPSQKPKVFYAVWYNPLMSAGQGTFQNDLIQKAGGINIAANLTGWSNISIETVIADNPDIMIAGLSQPSIKDNNFKFINTDPRLADTSARKNGKVYGIDSNIVSRDGPRIVDALEQMAKMIHPELFK